jgi:carboxyl-terminal processing protease
MDVSTRFHRSLALAFGLVFGLALAACGSGSSRSSGIADDDCSIGAQNLAVYQTLQEYYLWYQELPEVDPLSFASPQALLDAVIFKPLDRFSFIRPAAEEDAFFGFGEFIGLGFRSSIAGGVVQASDVFEDSPAEAGGLVRGSRILAVDGVPIAQVLAAPGGFSGALGPAEVGVQVTLDFQNPDGGQFSEVFTKAVVAIPPVTAARVFEIDGVPTGYLVFRNFVEPGIDALDTAFATFRAANVTQLIVDLRYNTGGLVSVLEHFADLLGSRVAPAVVFARYEHNDKQSSRDREFAFSATPPAAALLLSRLVFITTEASASAAEMLINGMDPVLTIATVGSPTFGKPVGQLGFRFCEQVLRPVSFRTVNGLGVGDFFDGIPADCAATDTLDVAFGTPGEASFDTAVHWLEQGFCPQVAMRRLPEEPVARPRYELIDVL